MPNEEWRILAEEARQERDPNKLMDIVDALNRTLDEQEARRTGARREEHQVTHKLSAKGSFEGCESRLTRP
jgi:hypothetical protein